MTAAGLPDRLRADGFALAATEAGIRVTPKAKLTDDTRALILEHKAALLDLLRQPIPEPPLISDNRITCRQCANLQARRCLAAFRGEIVASRMMEPIADLPKRCDAFKPLPGDPDQRTAVERWTLPITAIERGTP
jgi:hypothetical protein